MKSGGGGGLLGGRRAAQARAPRVRLPLLISVDRDLCLVCAIGATLVVSLLLYSGLLHLGGGGLAGLSGGVRHARPPRRPGGARPGALSDLRAT